MNLRTYVVAADPYDGWAKVGTTNGNVCHRLAELQTGNPYQLRCLAHWETRHGGIGPYVDVESVLHEHFAAVRGRGEWFAMPAALLMEMSASDTYREGFRDIMKRWPSDRIWSLAERADMTIVDLAAQFDSRTRHALATRRLQSVV